MQQGIYRINGDLLHEFQLHGRWNYEEELAAPKPRGTLFHHYKTDETGKLLNVNLLITSRTKQPSMNHSIIGNLF